jgi:hypothetical protein
VRTPVKRTARLVVGGFFAVGLSYPISAQQTTVGLSDAGDAVLFADVSLIPMDRQRVLPGQTVVVRDGRILAIGASGEVAVPKGATVIHGQGRFLVPGLTDAHVHLVGDGTGFGTARPDFGDGPLYLAYGVTTVFNLRGTAVQLEWRQRIENGELVGPTIYTSGEFVNEPRVRTPEDLEREISAQAHAGYDLIKFHEIYTAAGSVTTTGLALPAYLKMNEAARAAGIPLVGHAPVNLGLDALLQARQPLAHTGMLSNIYFLPFAGNRTWLFVTAASLIVLLIGAAVPGVAAIIHRWRITSRSRLPSILRVRVLAGIVLTAWVLAGVSAALFLPGGPLFDSLTLRVAFTVLILLIAVATVMLVGATAAVLRNALASPGACIQAAIVSVSGAAALCAALIFWLPVAWRSSDRGIERLAMRLHDAGISVQTTLVAYDAIGGPGRLRLVQDPVMGYLQPDVRGRWLRGPQGGPPGYRYTEFMKKVAAALHRAGVPLIVGTDAMGSPRIAPGASLHHELRLLTESGLTSYDVIRAATVAPATFLGKDDEFGMIAVGRRADLLLIDGNPLEDIGRLKHPVGVMTRGKWFTREQLQRLLAALAREQ